VHQPLLGVVDLWLRWEQAGSGGLGFTSQGESVFGGSKLVAVDQALRVVGYYIKFMEESLKSQIPDAGDCDYGDGDGGDGDGNGNGNGNGNGGDGGGSGGGGDDS
jgi:hypothetical protein